MAEKGFTTEEWDQIWMEYTLNPSKYGLPRRQYGFVTIGSFNIRKLGNIDGRDENGWRFLADIISQFDLIGIQEIMDDLSGVRKIMEHLGPEFDMIVSDATGTFPGNPGLAERLGFIYNTRVIRRTEVATDITYDRSKVLETLFENQDKVVKEFEKYRKGLAKFQETKKSKDRPKERLPFFISFIRQPFCVSFEIVGHPGTDPYRIMAVNAHLNFGESINDRRQEFDALMDWIIERVKQDDKTYNPNFLLMGDLNLDFDDPERDRPRLETRLRKLNSKSGKDVSVYFPFLDAHPVTGRVFRTNARASQTFDHIGLFTEDNRFPTAESKDFATDMQRSDYGVFDFTNLFSKALENKPFEELTKKQKKDFFAKFEHRVSDHLPIWIRIPLPPDWRDTIRF